jgi:hypothetical protein
MGTTIQKPTLTLGSRIARAIRNDPKRAGILTVLVAILVVLQVRLQMSRGDSATTATASAQTSGQIGGTSQNHNGASGTAGQSGKPQDAIAALRAWMDAAPAPLGRNLFAVNLERFPQDGNRTSVAQEGGAGFWDELAKSMSSRADVRKERQILLENLQQQAGQMRLQSTMMGATPKAVIDGELVSEGDVVACGTGETRTTFRVLRIEPRRIIVEREGIKLEIQMK